MRKISTEKPETFATKAASKRDWITAELWDELERYVDHGIMTSNFIYCVLRNDLYAAARAASPVNEAILGNVARFVFEHVPYAAYGSREKIAAWKGTQTDD